MAKISPVKGLRRKIIWTTVVVLLTLSAQLTVNAQRGAAEQKTAGYFESIRKSPPKQLAFLLKMPKGGDLHNHLSGSIYAERYIEWAAESGLCINTATMSLVVPADAGQYSAHKLSTLPADDRCVVHAQLAVIRTKRARSIL
jgi:hypothetical protein